MKTKNVKELEKSVEDLNKLMSALNTNVAGFWYLIL